MKPVRSAVLVALLLGCNHTEPFGSRVTGSDGPFNDGSPAKLTFNPGDDRDPFVASPGELSYRYQRGTEDGDFCAAILPASGGSRTVEICAQGSDDAARSDLFANLVRLGDGNLAWTHHWGGIGNQSPQSGGLYLGGNTPADSAIRVLQLLARPAGATARWDQLIDPVRTGPTELTALAAQWAIGPIVRGGPVDTVIQGVEIVRIDLTTNPASITSLAPTPNAIAWSRDPSNGTIYYAVPTYFPEANDSILRPAADTIFRLSTEGADPVYGRPVEPGQVSGAVVGFAVANGRLFVSRQSVFQAGSPPHLQWVSQIAEVRNGNELGPMEIFPATGPDDYWGRLAITTDGQALIAERRKSSGSDLYRIQITP